MPLYYADASALVKRHVREAGSQWFRALVELPTTLIVTGEFSIVEVFSALNRRRRERTIARRAYADITANFLHVCRSEYQLVPLSEPIIHVACSLLERHPLRTLDALHLATARHIQSQLQVNQDAVLIFLAADAQLLLAAASEGLQIHNPASGKQE